MVVRRDPCSPINIPPSTQHNTTQHNPPRSLASALAIPNSSSVDRARETSTLSGAVRSRPIKTCVRSLVNARLCR